MKRLFVLFLLALTLTPTLTAQWHGYLYVERLNLTDQQTADLINGIKTLGRRNDAVEPCYRNHWRVRLDNNAAIFEAEWDNATVSAEAVKNRLATLFGVNANLVTYTTTQTAYGPTVVYRYANQNRVRFGVFGGLTTTWAESLTNCIAYLLANLAAWEPVTP